jgi:VCBS repeat-containing protein
VNEDETLVVADTDGLLSNDVDVPSDTLAVVLHASPARGVVTLTTSGVFTYIPEANFFGADTFTYTVSDGDDGATATVHITVTGVNDPPEVMNPGPQINTVGDVVSRTIEASDVESDLLTYSASGLPPGLSINPTGGLISGTCGTISVGDYTVTVAVLDSISTTNVTFGWTIIDPGGQIYLPLVVRNYVSMFGLRYLPAGNGF